MPIRLCLCLSFALLSATAMARDIKMSSPASGSCTSSEADAPDREARPARHAPALPAREAKPRPSLHSDSPRLMPRWHSFLPGMFR